MGIYAWDSFGLAKQLTRTPHLTVLRLYPDMSSPPDEVTFRLSPRYGIYTALKAHEWFLAMLRKYEEFEVETDEPGEPPLSFWSETVRGVMVE